MLWKTVAMPTQSARCCAAAKRNEKAGRCRPASPFLKYSMRLRAGDFLDRDFYAGSHGRRDGNLLHELALRSRRLVPDDRIHERGEILLEVALGEARLADA